MVLKSNETEMYVSGGMEQKLVNWTNTRFQDFGKIRPLWQIISLQLSKDDKKLFIGFEDGYLVEWCTEKNKIEKSYKFIYYWIGCMCIEEHTPRRRYLKES